MVFDEDHFASATAERFDANRTRAGKSVDEPGIGNTLSQNIEERLAQAIARGAQSKPLQAFERTAAKFTGNHAHGSFDASSTDVSKMVAPLPLRRQKAQHLLQTLFLPGIFDDGKRFLTSKFQKFAVAQGARDMETKFPGLARAKKLAGPADLQIGFSNLEAIGGTHHGFQANARVVAPPVGGNEDAMRSRGTTADATA
jgi:hypothetical protein